MKMRSASLLLATLLASIPVTGAGAAGNQSSQEAAVDKLEDRAPAQAKIEQGRTALQAGRYDEALRLLDEAMGLLENAADANEEALLAQALHGKGYALYLADRNQAAIDAFDDWLARFGESENPKIRTRMPFVMIIKGEALEQEGRLEEAVASFDAVVSRFGRDESFARQTAVALFDKGKALRDSRNSSGAIKAFDEVERRFGASRKPEVLELVAQALNGKAIALEDAGQLQKALKTYDRVAERFGSSDILALRAAVAGSLVDKAGTLLNTGVFDAPTMSELVEEHLMGQGRIERDPANTDKAIEVFEEVDRRFGTSQEPEILIHVLRALSGKATALARTNRLERALRTYDDAIERFGALIAPALEVEVARLLFSKAMALQNAGTQRELGDAATAMKDATELQQAIETFDQVIERFGDTEAPTVQAMVAQSLISKAYLVGGQGKIDEGFSIYNDVIRRFGDSDAPLVQYSIGEAFLGVARFHMGLWQLDEAEQTLDALISRLKKQLDRGGRGGRGDLGHLLLGALLSREDLNRQREWANPTIASLEQALEAEPADLGVAYLKNLLGSEEMREFLELTKMETEPREIPTAITSPKPDSYMEKSRHLYQAHLTKLEHLNEVYRAAIAKRGFRQFSGVYHICKGVDWTASIGSAVSDRIVVTQDNWDVTLEGYADGRKNYTNPPGVVVESKLIFPNDVRFGEGLYYLGEIGDGRIVIYPFAVAVSKSDFGDELRSERKDDLACTLELEMGAQ